MLRCAVHAACCAALCMLCCAAGAHSSCTLRAAPTLTHPPTRPNRRLPRLPAGRPAHAGGAAPGQRGRVCAAHCGRRHPRLHRRQRPRVHGARGGGRVLQVGYYVGHLPVVLPPSALPGAPPLCYLPPCRPSTHPHTHPAPQERRRQGIDRQRRGRGGGGLPCGGQEEGRQYRHRADLTRVWRAGGRGRWGAGRGGRGRCVQPRWSNWPRAPLLHPPRPRPRLSCAPHLQAVVVSIDPKRVWVADPATTTHHCVKASTPGESGGRWAAAMRSAAGLSVLEPHRPPPPPAPPRRPQRRAVLLVAVHGQGRARGAQRGRGAAGAGAGGRLVRLVLA